MKVSKLQLAKERLIEFIKYDYNSLKFPLVATGAVAAWALKLLGKHDKAFNIASGLYRTGWAGSYKLGLHVAKYYFASGAHNSQLIEGAGPSITATDSTNKIAQNPESMLGGTLIALKPYKEGEKGALLLKYSPYFEMFREHFRVEKILERYNLILEPSWAGFCERSILPYGLYQEPVFIHTYEQRDKNFIESVGTQLKAIAVGPSWFVNHEAFTPPDANAKRDIDIIMVAGWASFKRHHQFLKAIKKLRAQGVDLNVVFVGYSSNRDVNFIQPLLEYHGLQDYITVYEWITPAEVAELFKRSKINILWSKFEGNNRAIIEGMFCDTPGILREGHNYGEHYDFINPKTGVFANDSNLVETIKHMLKNQNQFAPRDYVMNHRSCELATQIMSEDLKRWEVSQGRAWTEDLVVKINELNSMLYQNKHDKEKFQADYNWLKTCTK